MKKQHLIRCHNTIAISKGYYVLLLLFSFLFGIDSPKAQTTPQPKVGEVSDAYIKEDTSCLMPITHPTEYNIKLTKEVKGKGLFVNAINGIIFGIPLANERYYTELSSNDHELLNLFFCEFTKSERYLSFSEHRDSISPYTIRGENGSYHTIIYQKEGEIKGVNKAMANVHKSIAEEAINQSVYYQENIKVKVIDAITLELIMKMAGHNKN